MDYSWLEDFLALAESENFSRAAEQRHITQPAFSRRIRALENWVGVALFARDKHGIELTSAGRTFQPYAEEASRRLTIGREQALEASRNDTQTLRFAATLALSQTFFPVWLADVEQQLSFPFKVRLDADNMVGCERMMLRGSVQFLFCHSHPAASSVLDASSFRSVQLSDDILVPVSAPSSTDPSRPAYELPGTVDAPVPYLAYSDTSGMGRIVASARALDGPPAWMSTAFTSHIATVLVAMARYGRGMAWSPMSLVMEDLARGRLIRAGDSTWEIPIEIRLFRHRSRQSPVAEAFWSAIAG